MSLSAALWWGAEAIFGYGTIVPFSALVCYWAAGVGGVFYNYYNC
jgi:hypothetical protein